MLGGVMGGGDSRQQRRPILHGPILRAGVHWHLVVGGVVHAGPSVGWCQRMARAFSANRIHCISGFTQQMGGTSFRSNANHPNGRCGSWCWLSSTQCVAGHLAMSLSLPFAILSCHFHGGKIVPWWGNFFVTEQSGLFSLERFSPLRGFRVPSSPCTLTWGMILCHLRPAWDFESKSFSQSCQMHSRPEHGGALRQPDVSRCPVFDSRVHYYFQLGPVQ